MVVLTGWKHFCSKNRQRNYIYVTAQKKENKSRPRQPNKTGSHSMSSNILTFMPLKWLEMVLNGIKRAIETKATGQISIVTGLEGVITVLCLSSVLNFEAIVLIPIFCQTKCVKQQRC